MFCSNRQAVIALCKEVKEKYPTKNIWLYSGFRIEEVWDDDTMREILYYVDVLVDGRFVQELKDLSLPFRGSSNQRLIDVKSWLLDKCKDGFQDCV